MGSLSIKNRLFAYSMLFCFVGLVAVGGYSYFLARKALLKRTFEQLTSVREEKGRQIEFFFKDRAREAELVSANSEVIALFQNSKIENVNIPSNLFPIFKFLAKTNSYSSIGFALTNGTFFCVKLTGGNSFSDFILATDKSDDLKRLYQRVCSTGEVIIQDFIKGSLLNSYSAFVVAPVYSAENLFVGALYLEIPEESLNSLIAENQYEIGLGKTGEVYLVGSDLLMRSSSRFVDNSVLSVKCNTSSVNLAFKGSTGVSKIFDYRQVKVLSSYRPLNIVGLNWVIAAEMDWNEALLDIVTLKNRIVIIGIIVFALITFGVYLFSAKITLPLVKLKEAAVRVGQGKFDLLLSVEQRDEIGLLTQVFNKMTLRLKHTTLRLKEREQRLLHFYRATVDGIMLHKNGKPILINRAFTTLSGYSEDELLKKSPETLFCEDDNAVLYKSVDELTSLETLLVCKNSKKMPVEVQRRKIMYLDQEVDAIVVRDISERKAIENELKAERLHRLRSVIDGQEQERQRLSRELHDGLGQTLVAIKLRLESIPLNQLGEQRKTIEMVKEMFNHTIEETRRMSNNLMPAALTEFSLAVVLRNLCNEIQSNSGITVSLVVGVLPESIDLLTKTYAYRIAQEALTNVVKHSRASRVVVSVFSDIQKVYLQIEDNGVGFKPSQLNENGNGLFNMKERASLLNGKIEIASSPGEGVKLKVGFPIISKKHL